MNRHRQAFDLDSDARIVAYGLAGNDTISAGNVGYPVEFYGGLGNDYLRGADGDDLLSGGAGNDLILGGDGDNLR